MESNVTKMIADIFDKYGRQARLFPALLALFPVFITVAVWVPALYQLGVGLVALAIACGLLTALAHFSRTRGRIIEKKLVREWGGLPTTIWLRRSDENLEWETKQRYYDFFEVNVPGWKQPQRTDNSADEVYKSAVRWLLERTRDTVQFPLVFAENISYGFRRNCLGLKSFAVSISVLVFGVASLGLYGNLGDELLEKFLPQISAGIITFLLFFWWVFGVNRNWVRDAGDSYAKALLGSCDRF